jgi:hypothetical protein
MNSRAVSRAMRRLAPGLLVLLSLIAAIYAALQGVNFPFIADDNDYLTSNARLAALPAGELWRLLLEPYNPWEFLPLRDLSYWLDLAAFGLNPVAFRLHNIVLYVLCCLLVYAATHSLWRYFHAADRASAHWFAATVTALFTIHPAHVEAVIWISGRKDLLSTLFSLLALWCAVHARHSQGLSRRYAIAALLALLAAIFSKASAVAVAPVIGLLWLMFWRDAAAALPATAPAPPAQTRRSATPHKRVEQSAAHHYRILLWSAAALLLAAGPMLFFISNSTVKTEPYWGIETLTRALAIVGWLTRLAVTPEDRHFFYPVFEDPWLPAMIILGAAILLAATAGAVAMRRRRALDGYALVAFALLCLPYTQLIPFETFSLVSDRFLALALWPFLMLLVALLWRLSPWPRMVILLVIGVLWCGSAAERLPDWRSDEALINAELRAYPGHYQPAFQQVIGILIPQALHAEAAQLAGRVTLPEFRKILLDIVAADAMRTATASSGDSQQAVQLLTKLGLDLKHMPAQAYWNQPMSYVWKSCRNIFALEWHDLVRHFPNVMMSYRAGLSLIDAQQHRSAVPLLRAAANSPELPQQLRGTALSNLGLALLKSGQAAAAVAPLQAALNLPTPEPEAYCVLSAVYERIGRPADAAAAAAECSRRTGSKAHTPVSSK